MAEGNCPIASRSSFTTAITIGLNLAVLAPTPFQLLTGLVNSLCTRANNFVAIRSRDRPKLEGRSQRYNQPRQHNPAWIRHRRPAIVTMMANGRRSRPLGASISTNMDPEVRQFVISQLVVIALPVGTLFGLWLWMLNWSGRSRRNQ